ncbi:MAG: helix-turn-helix domain-containing protein [Halobacteriales archaeon]|nr:helix-turn-helix domain-containing protein [Halobacteriales archaeon]
MKGGPRRKGAIALLLLAALVAVPALAAAQTPGTVSLAFRVSAGPVELKPKPLDVPDPWVPNPMYEALLAADASPAPDAAPVQVTETPEGVFVDAPSGPLRVVGYTTGFEQKHIAPVEWAGHVFDANTQGLPVGIDGCTCPARAPTVAGTYKDLVLPLGPPAASHLAVPGVAPPAVDERAGIAGSASVPGTRPDDYRFALPPGSSEEPASSATQAVAVDPSPAAPIVLVVAAAASLVALKLLTPLYHRFKKKTALDNGTRKLIYEMLRAAPGANAAEMSAQSGLHVTTVKYHLDVLRKVGMVGEQVVDGCRRFYSYENGDRMEFLTRALLDEPAARAIYRQIEQHPGLPFIEVARALGMRKEHVHYHVKKLTKHGLVTDRWEAGRRLLFAAPPQTGSPASMPNPSLPQAVPSVTAAPVATVALVPLLHLPPEVKG